MAVRTLANYSDQFLYGARGICNRCNLQLVIVSVEVPAIDMGITIGLRSLHPVIVAATINSGQLNYVQRLLNIYEPIVDKKGLDVDNERNNSGQSKFGLRRAQYAYGNLG